MTRISILCALLLFATPSVAETEVGQERSDFTGTWQLDEELSDDPREKMREAMRDRGGGRGGGFGRRGGGRGGGFGGRGSSGGERGGGPMRDLAQGAEQLTITHQEPSFRVVDAAERERLVSTDGEAHELTTPAGDLVELSAEWKRGDRLELVMERPERPKMTETYELVAEGTRLYVTIEIEGQGRRPSLEFRRVYDRILPDEEPVEEGSEVAAVGAKAEPGGAGGG